MSTNIESIVRIAELKQKIFWRDVLSFLICILPPFMLGASTYWVMNTGWMTIFFASFFAFIGFVFWLTGNFDNAANFLFGDKFRVQSKRFLEIEKTEFRALEHEKRRKREAKEAEMIAALEQDMRLTGILKEPTKEAP